MSLDDRPTLSKRIKKMKIKRGKNDGTLVYSDEMFPLLTDPLFSYRIGKRREFFENAYIDYIEGNITDKKFKQKSDLLCNLPFSLAPHQRFVKNFMSFNTPYNSLLLYHGLGTGKTCSAMGICEEMRNYMKKIGSAQKIIIIASPNVQDNFKSQLFNKYKLKKINGKWNLESCVGDNLIDEVTKNVSQNFKKDVLIRSVERLIKKFYMFVGYQEFSNFFNKKILKSLDELKISDEQRKQIVQKRIQSYFGNRLVVVDEAHNLRPSNKKEKGVGNVLTQIVENTSNMRLLLLSATPMYNTPQEIIWILNLMCKNDNIPILESSEVFDSKGNLKITEDGDGNIVDIGAKKLSQKMSGHVSFVRGDNPFTFPFSLYPEDFERGSSVKSLKNYPEKMMNGREIIQPLEYLDCYMTDVGDRQKVVYTKILEELIQSLIGENDKLEDMEGFGYNFIQPLLDSLIISFPSLRDEEKGTTYLNYTGKRGLEGVVDFNKKTGYNTDFTYKRETRETYGRIFSKNEIGNYSGKIKSILDNIHNSDGIVMVYSQFLDGSLIPLALALEEDGYERTTVANGRGLFSDDERKAIKAQPNFKIKGNYAFITGNSGYSPNNAKELATIVADSNKDGDEIKVVLISRAGSEGLDFKNIRQLHILEPWYNTKRIEQIIGRGVRNCSHKTLPFEKRNVCIYLHASNPFIKKNKEYEEPADLYVYRYAERGTVKIGIITRLLKETSVDCLVNNHMIDFDIDKLNLSVAITLPDKRKIEYQVGDKPYTSICDYMKKCSYVCKKATGETYRKSDIDEIKESKNTEDSGEIIDPSFYENDLSNIITKISSLFLENYSFSFSDIHKRLQGYAGKQYSHIQLIAALNTMVENTNIKVIDNFGRYGHLVKIGDVYFFNPNELLVIPNDYFEIKTPVEFKHDKLLFKQSKRKTTKTPSKYIDRETVEDNTEKRIVNTIKEIQANLNIAFGQLEKIKNDKNWYRLCGYAIPELMTIENISIQKLEKYIIHHYIDFDFDFKKKKEWLEYIFTGDIESFSTTLEKKHRQILQIAIEYISSSLIINHKEDNERKIIGMFDENYIFNYYLIDSGILKIAKPEDINDFKSTIIDFQKSIVGKFADYVGFTIVFKENRITFKVKHMKQKRSKGARCDQAGKSNSISLINDFRDESIKGAETNKNAIKKLGKLITNAVCVYQELLLRSYNGEKHKGKIWFIPFEYYKQTNIEKITI